MIGPDVVRILDVGSAPPPGLPSLNLRQNIDWTERETVRRALDSAGGVKKDAAEAMGISQRALSYYLAKHRVELITPARNRHARGRNPRRYDRARPVGAIPPRIPSPCDRVRTGSGTALADATAHERSQLLRGQCAALRCSDCS